MTISGSYRAVALLSEAPRREGVRVPWCEQCNRSYNPSSVAPDGTCVTCGTFIAEDPDANGAASRTPWHFWVLVAALVLYLGWRLIEFIIWLVT